MLPTVADLKTYIRVEHDDENLLLQELLDSAVEYVQTATGRDFAADTPSRARTAIVALAGHWFDHRLPTEGDVRVVPFHVRSLIHQLRNWQDPAVVRVEP